ncbi:hypothetical protein AB0F72_08930 [Actinoplanes sp. NPDC023936]|uniref:hypothetical protein n=1 Tax=Actinoplanes sp. NPDC023936 TaxID=3154910 RepID=UPI0033F20FD9
MTELRWQWLDNREQPDGSMVVYHWPLNVVERYCVDSGNAVRAIPGDRCLSHGDRDVMCTTAQRMPPECRHLRLSPNHPYPHCSECGVTGEDVTAEVASGR